MRNWFSHNQKERRFASKSKIKAREMRKQCNFGKSEGKERKVCKRKMKAHHFISNLFRALKSLMKIP